MSKIRVLIVDDSAYSRQTIKKMLESDSYRGRRVTADGIVQWQSPGDPTSLLWISNAKWTGSVSWWLMKNRPTPVIIVSSYSIQRLFSGVIRGAASSRSRRIPSAEFEKGKKSWRKIRVKMSVLIKWRNLELLERQRYNDPLEKTLPYRRSQWVINRRSLPENYDKASIIPAIMVNQCESSYL
jgi:hypothetical protein